MGDFGSPTVIASIVAGIIGVFGTLIAARIQHFFRQQVAAENIAERGLSAQLSGWSDYCDRLNGYIALLQEQNTRLQNERSELWEHNRKQDLALFDCEEKNATSDTRIRALELRLAKYENGDG